MLLATVTRGLTSTMFFTHPTNPDVKSSRNLLLLQYGTERVVVEAPHAYSTAVDVARQEFGISPDAQVQFYTADVPANAHAHAERTPVRIAASAWAGLLAVMATVEVRLVQPAQEAAGLQTPAPSAGPSQPAAAPSHDAKTEIPNPSPPAGEALARGHARPSAAPTRAPTSRSAAKPSSSRRSAQPSPGPSKPAPSKPASSKSAPSKPAASKPSSKPAKAAAPPALAPLSEDDSLPRSPQKKAKRRIVESDAELDAEVPASTKRRRTSPEAEGRVHEHVEEPMEGYVEDYVEDNVEENEEEQAQEQAQEEEVEFEVIEDRVHVKEEEALQPRPAAARSEALKASTARDSPVRTPRRGPTRASPPKPAARAYDPNASFVICVMYADGAADEDGECGSQFKTKNKHTVRKVLWTACRTFGIQDSYDELGLFMRTDDGWDHLCNEDCTVGELGITADTYLSIQSTKDLDREETSN